MANENPAHLRATLSRDPSLETERTVSRHHVCDGCGSSLAGKRPQARFCSDECRSAARRLARNTRLDSLLTTIEECLTELRREVLR